MAVVRSCWLLVEEKNKKMGSYCKQTEGDSCGGLNETVLN